MKNIYLLLVLFYFHSNAQQHSNYDSIMHAQVNFNGVVLVAENGKVQFHEAYGFRTFIDKQPLKKDDIFELASISKQFTAMIIMMLQEQHLLKYDDPVSKYLTIPYKGITIRHLLTHTSGLPDYQDIMDKHWDKTKVAGNSDILEFLNQYAPPTLFDPGTQYAYSNTGYVLLASIAEKASNVDFIELCRALIFEPLKMKDTDIRSLQVKAKTKNFAIGHLFVPERNLFVRADSFPSSNYTIWLGNRKGPGRMSSTATDLLKWSNALYTDRLLKDEMLKEAFRPMSLKNNSLSWYGFGWELSEKNPQRIQHTGDNPGYHNIIVRKLDNRKTVIILTNNGFKDVEGLATALIAQ